MGGATRLLLGLVLILLSLGLTPLAFADPPDQSWLGGYWENDDFDNVVSFITQATGLVVVFASPPSMCEATAPMDLSCISAPSTPAIGVGSSRAPPLVAIAA
jgi:hypothetical protein